MVIHYLPLRCFAPKTKVHLSLNFYLGSRPHKQTISWASQIFRNVINPVRPREVAISSEYIDRANLGLFKITYLEGESLEDADDTETLNQMTNLTRIIKGETVHPSLKAEARLLLNLMPDHLNGLTPEAKRTCLLQILSDTEVYPYVRSRAMLQLANMDYSDQGIPQQNVVMSRARLIEVANNAHSIPNRSAQSRLALAGMDADG